MKKTLLSLISLFLITILGSQTMMAQCYSAEGTIMVNSIYICEGDAAIVDADDFLLIPGQSVYYVYHTNAGVSLTNPPSSAETITYGSFLQNGASVSGTVYVTAFGATNDGNGGPNYLDPCLTMSNTVALNFLNPISILVSEDCDTGNGEFNYTFTVTGGLPGAVSSDEYIVTGDYFNGPAGLSGSVTIGPITDGSSYNINVIDGNGCEASYTGSIECEKLPVELISFDLTKSEAGNLLSWETATEIENSHFTILKSRDGLVYSEIARIEGAGNSIESTRYSHLDMAPFQGINYYKLVQTDYDGSMEELGIRTISSDTYTLSEISIYPQPVNESLTFTFLSNENTSLTVEIIDLKGAIFMSKSLESDHGLNEVKTDIIGLNSGTYLLRIYNENFSSSNKFVKN